MKCPSCAAPAGDDASECPACGLVFAKWRARQEKEKQEAAAALASLEAPASAPPVDPWVVRGAAAAVVAAWMLGLGWYVLRHPAKRAPALGADTGQFVEFRDPRTGDMRRMPIQRMGGVPMPPATADAEPSAPPQPAPSSSAPLLPPGAPGSSSGR